MKRLRMFILMLSVSCITSLTFAQQITVTGTVTSENDNSPLPGVTVMVKNTEEGTITDIDGNYSIMVETGQTLVFSFVGMESQEIVVNNNTINTTLAESQLSLDQVVVIGYGAVKKSDLTGAVSVIETDEMQKMASSNISKALQGMSSGVTVQSGGTPGAVPQVKIRGIGSFNNTDPLYIVDGIQMDVRDIPLNNVESVQVLKDGAAAAIYGTRAANGVIIITTKKGQAGEVKVDFKGYVGVQNIVGKYDVANREEYQMLVNEATANANYSPVGILPFNDPDSEYYVDNIDTDWQDEVYKTGRITDHSLTVSGGSENSTFSATFNYFDQTGTIEGKGPSYERFGITVKGDHKKGRFSIGEKLHFTYVNQRFMPFVHDGTALGYAISAAPTIPVYDASTIDGYGAADKNLDGSYTLNMIGVGNLIDSKTDRYNLTAKVYAGYELAKDLNYKADFSYSKIDYHDFHFQPVHNLGWFYENSQAVMNDDRGYDITTTFEQTLSYNKTFGKHKVTGLLGNTVQKQTFNLLQGAGTDFPEPYFYKLQHATENVSANNNEWERRLMSYFGRVIYEFNNKYMIQATLRRDGSSKFGEEYRWGDFSSVAAGWKIHNESFMAATSDYLSQLKLRASYGELGSQEIEDYRYSAFISPEVPYVFNGIIAPGSIQILPATPDIRWEEKISKNIGLDIGFKDQKYTLSVDYFNNRSNDVLYKIPVPGSTGLYDDQSPIRNSVSIENSGVEFQAGASHSFGELKINVNANVSTMHNEVLSMGPSGEPVTTDVSKTEKGREIGELYGYVVEDIFQTQEEIDELNALSATGRYQETETAPGDYKFKDIDGNGYIDDADRTYLGSAFPNLYYGLNLNMEWKNFDFSLAANGSSGNKIVNTIQNSIEAGAGWDNYAKTLLNRWTPDNTNTDIPRVVIADPNKNSRFSDRKIEDGDYLKITNLQLGYTIPSTVLEKINLSYARLYVAAQNLYTFTNYSGFDPDFQNDGMFNRAVDMAGGSVRYFTAENAGSLPNPRTFLLGVQVSF